MAKTEKPSFGRKMIPCVYQSLWANKLPENERVSIPAEDTKRIKEQEETR